MTILKILVLAVVQGFAELLPISSSAHVILAEKLMGLDPTAPDMTLLLVMLHTGTMFAVIVYFWRSWKATYFEDRHALWSNGVFVGIATALTGVVGLFLLKLIEHIFASGSSSFEIEQLFGNMKLIAGALGAAGALILVSARLRIRRSHEMTVRSAAWIGAVQGLCLPFRGFSRSGVTISVGLLEGISRRRAEEFSFALAVVLTPPVIVREGYRFYKSTGALSLGATWLPMLLPSVLGMVFSFVAGLVALRWLSRWLEEGRWAYFGIYCLLLSIIIFVAAT